MRNEQHALGTLRNVNGLRVALLQTRLILRRCDELLSRQHSTDLHPHSPTEFLALPTFHNFLLREAATQSEHLRSLRSSFGTELSPSTSSHPFHSSPQLSQARHEQVAREACSRAVVVLCASLRAVGGDASAERVILRERIEQYCAALFDCNVNCEISNFGDNVNLLLQDFDAALRSLDVESARLLQIDENHTAVGDMNDENVEGENIMTDPISPEEIDETIPSSKVSEFLCSKYIDRACAVCFEDYDQHDEIRKFIPCSHLFHKSCIDRWLLEDLYRALHGPKCPLCRSSLPRSSTRQNVTRV